MLLIAHSLHFILIYIDRAYESTDLQVEHRNLIQRHLDTSGRPRYGKICPGNSAEHYAQWTYRLESKFVLFKRSYIKYKSMF